MSHRTAYDCERCGERDVPRVFVGKLLGTMVRPDGDERSVWVNVDLCNVCASVVLDEFISKLSVLEWDEWCCANRRFRNGKLRRG